MKMKRHPKGYKSREDFEQKWIEKINPSFEDNCSHCFEELKEPFHVEQMKMVQVPNEVAKIIEDFGGLYIPIFLIEDEKLISAMCTEEDSPAKREGFDLIFPVCENCKSGLIKLLEKYFSGDLSKQVLLIRIELPIEEWFEEISGKGVLEVAKILAFLQSFKNDKGKTH